MPVRLLCSTMAKLKLNSVRSLANRRPKHVILVQLVYNYNYLIFTLPTDRTQKQLNLQTVRFPTSLCDLFLGRSMTCRAARRRLIELPI